MADQKSQQQKQLKPRTMKYKSVHSFQTILII